MMGLKGVCTSPNGVAGCKSSTCPGGSINANLDIIRSSTLSKEELAITFNAIASDMTQLFPEEQDSLTTTLSDYEKAALAVTPVNTDVALSEIYERAWSKRSDIDRLNGYIKDYQQHLDPNYRYYREYEVESYKKRIADAEARVANEKEILKSIEAEATPLEAIYDAAGRWSRAFLVQNGNGHVHKSMNCDTCYPSTRFAWLPQYSGQSEELLVADAGEAACTRCFPSAPVDALRQKSKIQTPEQKLAAAEKAAAKAEREAKKQATGIWNPDGTELKVQSSWSNYKETIKTERTAQIWAVDALLEIEDWKEKRNDPKWAQDNLDEKITRIEENSEKVIAALAAKRGVSSNIVRAELEVKAAKKRKARGW
jgi:hypothetical protein